VLNAGMQRMVLKLKKQEEAAAAAAAAEQAKASAEESARRAAGALGCAICPAGPGRAGQGCAVPSWAGRAALCCGVLCYNMCSHLCSMMGTGG
jgi:hypothetical protein